MKSHNFTLILLVFSALMKSATAQLSGVYTIGGTTPDYATIQAAVTALQTSGVNGAVIFNIRPGTYSGKVDLGVVAGASATNTILFRAENFDSTSVIITDSASATGSNFTFHVFGTDYLTVSHVTVRRPGTNANSIVFSISSNSQHFQIRNCIIESNITTSTNSTSSLVSIPLGGVNDSLFTFANNIFRGGSMGLEIKGQGIGSPIPLMQITNNQFIDQSFRAMQLTYLISPNIQNNNISTHSTNTVYRGISLARGTGIITISANKITGINSGGDALHLDTCAGTLGNAAMIYNNFLQTQGTGTVRGLYMSNCTFLNIYYNSINITTTGGFNNAALYLNGSNNSQLNVKNNILMNTGGGYTYYIPVGALGNLVSSDHNDLYVASGDTTIAYLDTGDVSTLANWQTRSSLDANSVSGDPQFISATDLHAGSPAVNNLGVVITGITTDIDGQTRNVTTPDIGADEFTPLNANIGMVSFIAPETGICGDSAITVGVIIHNYGLNNQTGFPMHADITGAVVQNLTQNYSGSLVSNTSDTVYFTQTINTYSGGIIDITAYLSLAADQYRLNDTIRGSFEFGGHPNAPAAVSPQQQCDNNVQITATADSGDVLAWYADSIGGNLIFVGDTLVPELHRILLFMLRHAQEAEREDAYVLLK